MASALRNAIAALRGRLRTPFAPPRAPSPQQTLANVPKPTAASPWGSPTFLDYWTGGITTNPMSRNRNNYPLFYDAQNNYLTMQQGPMRAYFGLNARFDPQIDAVLKSTREQQQEMVKFQAAASLAQAQASRGEPETSQTVQEGGYRDLAIRQADSTMTAHVQQLSRLYTTGQIDTPGGIAEQERILALYQQYAPRGARVVDVTGPAGQTISIPLPEETPEDRTNRPLFQGFVNWVNKFRARPFGDPGDDPLKAPDILGWLNRARRNLYGEMAGEPLTTLNIAGASPAFQEFRDNYWGGKFFEDWYAVGSGVVADAFGELRQQSPAFELANSIGAYSLNIGAWETIKGGISLAWSHAMNALKIGNLGGGDDAQFDKVMASQIGRDMQRIGASLNPPAMMLRTMTDAYYLASSIIEGMDEAKVLTTLFEPNEVTGLTGDYGETGPQTVDQLEQKLREQAPGLTNEFYTLLRREIRIAQSGEIDFEERSAFYSSESGAVVQDFTKPIQIIHEIGHAMQGELGISNKQVLQNIRNYVHRVGPNASLRIGIVDLSAEKLLEIPEETAHEWYAFLFSMTAGDFSTLPPEFLELFGSYGKKLDVARVESSKPFESVSILGIPLTAMLGPTNETNERQAEGMLNNVLESIDRIKEEGVKFYSYEEMQAQNAEKAANNQHQSELMEIEAQKLKELVLTLELAESFNDVELVENARGRALATAERLWTAIQARTDISDHSYRWTWDWEFDGDEREAAARQAIIEAMVVKGRPLLPWEIRRITDRFTSAGTEFVGEALLDLTNLIPGALLDNGLRFLGGMAKLPFKGAMILPGKIIKAIDMNAYIGMRRFFTTRALASAGVHIGNLMNEGFFVMRRYVHDDAVKFFAGVEAMFKRQAGGQIDLRPFGVLNMSIRKFDEAIRTFGDGLTYEKLIKLIENSLENKGLALTPKNFTDEVAEVVREFYMSQHRLKGFYSTGALDEGFIKRLVDAGYADKGSISRGAIDVGLKMQRLFRQAWIPLVLTLRPGYTITNFADNAFRAAVVGGANLLLSFDTILKDLDYNILEGVKGGFHAQFDETSAKVADRLIRGELRLNFLDLFSDGFKQGWDKSKKFKWYGALKQAWAQVNSASEFVFRTRVYHKQYMKNIGLLKNLISRHARARLAELGVLNDETEFILRQALMEAGNNPARAIQYLTGGTGQYSKLITPEIYQRWVATFGVDAADSMAGRVTKQLQQLVEQNKLTVENVRLIFDDIKTTSGEALNESLAHADDLGRHPEADLLDPNLPASAGVASPPAATTEEIAEDVATAAVPTAEVVPPVTAARAMDQAAMELDELLGELGIPLGNVTDELRNTLQTLQQQVKDIAGQRLSKATAALHDELRLVGAEVTQILETAKTTAGGVVQAADAEAVLGMQKIANYEDSLDKMFRGALRRFMAEVHPGPAFSARHGFPTAQGWKVYFEAEARALLFHHDENLRMLEIVKNRAWNVIDTELVTPTRAELFEKLGWKVNFNEEGRLLSIQPPTGMASSAHNGHFRQFFNFQTQEQFEKLPFTEAVPEHYKFRLPSDPGSAEELVQQYVSLESWYMILNQTVSGTNITYRQLIQNYLGPDALKSVDAFKQLGAQAFEGLRQSGDVRLAQELKDIFYDLEWQHNAFMQAEGYLGAAPARLQLHYLPPSIQSKVSAGRGSIAIHSEMLNILDEWTAYLDDAVTNNSWFVQALDPNTRKTMGQLGEELGRIMDDGMEAVNNGGRVLDQNFIGAISETNRVMINYEDYTPFDRFMKDNVFPFWMFPTRTLPMWANVLTSKPWLAAAYGKYLRLSERTAYKYGATTRSGDQLPSLTGYLPIPGTDYWIDPTQVLSMHYAMEFLVDKNERESDNLGPLQQLTKFVVKSSSMFGLFAHPMVLLALNYSKVLDANDLPRFPIIPQFKVLLPPVVEKYIISQLRNLGPTGRIAADVLDPEIGYRDFLIARRVLRNANEAVSKGNLSPVEAQKLAVLARDAINYVLRGEDQALQELWDGAKLQVANEEWRSSISGYMTAFYGKPFTDADAEFIMIRTEIDKLKASLNDAAQAAVFDLPVDVVERNEHYTRLRYETPEGFLANTYNLISNVRTDTGDPATNRVVKTMVDEETGQRRDVTEWEEIVSQKIYEEQQDEAAYKAISAAKLDFEERIAEIPVGSKLFYDALRQYSARLSQIDTAYPSSTQPGGRFFGYKPEYLVFNDLVGMLWRYWSTTVPRYDPDTGESYPDFKIRKENWISTLGDEKTREAMVLGFLQQKIWGPATRGTEPAIRFLDWQLNWPKDFEQRAIDVLTPEGYKEWVMRNDTEYEALLNAWEAIIWDPKWERLSGLTGHERDLASIQYDQALPKDAELNSQLIDWVMKEYGADRFDPKKLMYILNNADTITVDERLAEGKDEAALQGTALWDNLARIPPGRQHEYFLRELEKIYREQGLDERDAEAHLNTWYVSDGRASAFGDPAEFQQFSNAVAQAIENRGYPELNEDQLKEYIKAKDLNEAFRKVIETRLGKDFYDFQDEYYAMSPDQRRAFREQFPDAYRRILAYNDMRDEYATINPIWAKYYHREVVEALEAGEDLASALAGIGEGGGGGAGGGGRAGGGVTRRRMEIPPLLRPGFRAGTTGAEILGRIGKGGVAAKPIWPPRLLAIIGEPAAAEVEKAANANLPLSDSLLNYLKNLESNSSRSIPTQVREVYKNIKGGGGGRYLKV